jgi:hypothetical protein
MAMNVPTHPGIDTGDGGLGVASDALRDIITGFLNEVRFD